MTDTPTHSVSMDTLSRSAPAYHLFDLQSLVKSVISDAFPDPCWVVAEIAECRCNQRGHCYLELVEKSDERIIAQAKANIWAYDYRRIVQKFETSTRESLRAGMKILLLAVVSYHEVYGLSLNIKDIDPSYTMGEMALKKREVIERLAKEGLLDRNKSLPLPLVPMRIAVVSSPTAAGYGDFSEHLDNNSYGYRFVHHLFPALMQGEDAVASIISAFDRIRRSALPFDIVALIRGGGSAADLGCFDSYDLAAQIALFPLPVITGIGHEKDDTVVDMVSHTRMKTPTAVAEFLISGVRTFENTVNEIGGKIVRLAGWLLKDHHHRLRLFSQRLAHIPRRLIASRGHALDLIALNLRVRSKENLRRADETLQRLEQAVHLLDPANVLKRGFSITRRKGTIIKDAREVAAGAVIHTQLFHGTLTSIVKGHQAKEAKKRREQDEATHLLPGFE